MKKTTVIFIILLLSLSIAGIMTFRLTMSTFGGFFEDSPMLANLFAVASSDPDKGIYVIDSGKRGLKKVDREGRYDNLILDSSDELFSLTDKKEQYNNYIINDLDVDSEGNLYILRSYLNMGDLVVQKEQIWKYRPDDWKAPTLVHEQKYEDNQALIRSGKITSLTCRQDGLYFFFVDNQEVTLKRIGTDNRVNPLFTFPIPDGRSIHEITGYMPGWIYYTTELGELYRVDSRGESQTVPAELTSNTKKRSAIPQFLHLRNDADGNGFLYYIMPNENALYRISISHPEQRQVVFSGAMLPSPPPEGAWLINDYAVTDHEIIVATNDKPNNKTSRSDSSEDKLYLIDGQGSVKMISTFNPAAKEWVDQGTVLLLCMVVILMMAYTTYFAYLHILNRRLNIMIKQSLVSVVVFAIVVVGVGIVMRGQLEKYNPNITEEMKMLAQSGARFIEGDALQRIEQSRDCKGADYLKIQKSLHDLTIDEQIGYFSSLYQFAGGKLYPVIVGNDPDISLFQPVMALLGDGQYPASMKKCAQGSPIETATVQSDLGRWGAAFAPVKNSQGQVVGVFEVGRQSHGFEMKREAMISSIRENVFTSMTALFVAFMMVTLLLQRRIRQLRDSVHALEASHGTVATEVSVTSTDELGDLGRQFNHMARQIQMTIQHVTALKEAYSRFFPEHYLKALNKEITELKLGDNRELDQTVIMVSNLRRFQEQIKGKSSDYIFQYANLFFMQVGEVIQQQGGVICEYLESGVFVLFEGDVDGALDAAIEMVQRVRAGNRDAASLIAVASDEASDVDRNGVSPLENRNPAMNMKAGIALHYGQVKLGIMGTVTEGEKERDKKAERLEGNILSPDVTLSMLMDKLAEVIDVSILTTAAFIGELKNPDQYQFRSIGKLRFRGWERAVEMVDVYDSDSEYQKRRKGASQNMFNDAIRCYQNGGFAVARQGFLEVIRQNPEDKVAQLYFFQCDRYIAAGGVSDDWDGALNVTEAENG
ncbi:HAMP domain-containing protein [Heliobacterium gestii]|uniref:HAMP domain-containing protein n=1 Tax=Heliomicrobium gestii TaxID=2699 RepID=A0A845LIA7_HELGE|nr:HAMP domain-containing protein [Heliomicrobium gestii]MBM7868033.1 HAMP domain-containing protein/class 3 adenylate cyclase [Heliomicrobium gestii]MZP44299.1 HAMP domain-containing protein [Heliomicrobium gestii]